MKSTISLLCLFTLLVPAVLVAHPGADAALAHFSEQIRERPGDPSLYLQRGVVYSNDGQYPQALEDFQQAARLGERILVSFDLGVLYYRMGEFDTAKRYFDEFLQRFPSHTAALEYRARLLRDAGDYPASVADFRRLFELRERTNPGDYSSAANMLASAGTEGIEEALEILDLGNSKLGITPQLQHQAIELELRLNRTDRAIQRLRELGPMLGDSPEWKVDMADLLLQSGQPGPAATLLDAATTQLATLRKTPARQETVERIARLRSSDAAL